MCTKKHLVNNQPDIDMWYVCVCVCVCVCVGVPVKARADLIWAVRVCIPKLLTVYVFQYPIYESIVSKAYGQNTFDIDKAPHLFVLRLYKIKCIG